MLNTSSRIPLILIMILAMFCFRLNAQDEGKATSVDISRVQYVTGLSQYSSTVLISGKASLPEIYPSLSFRNGPLFKGTVPVEAVNKKAVLRFTVTNSADSAVSAWFFPGFFFTGIQLYKVSEGGVQPVAAVVPAVNDNLGYRKISILPQDTVTFLAELEFVRTHINSIRPRLIHDQRISSFIKEVQEGHRIENMMTFLFSGLLLMMILFSVATYLQGANKEFLYYAGYAFFLGGMLFTKAFFDLRPNQLGYLFEGFLDYIMQSLGIIFYMLFMQRFLESKTRHMFLHRLYDTGIAMLLFSIGLFTYFHVFTENFVAENTVENITKFMLLAMTVIFLVYSLRHWSDRLLRFLFWGNLLLLLFSFISLLLSLAPSPPFLTGIWNSALLYYELGLFLELVFFLAGLNYKNRRLIIAQTRERERLKTENQMKEYEKELAVYKAQQEERERISADMHDELGAGMTAIRLMSEIARNKMKESTPVEIERISSSADEVLNKMNAIIWSMNSGNDTLDNLISYIRAYALEYFESTSVECQITMPEEIEAVEITGDKRRNVFLCVKETLNNTLKHANATRVTIGFTVNSSLGISIADNGLGIDLENIRKFGNGLKNIARRMDSIGGTYSIKRDNGTRTELTLPLG